MSKTIGRDNIKKIRKMVKEGVPRYEVAKKLKVSVGTVYIHTSNMPKAYGNFGIRGHSLEMLQKIMKDGYLIPDKGALKTNAARHSYMLLRQKFPIKRSHFNARVAYYLEGKEKEAMKQLMQRKITKRVIGYNELSRIAASFGIRLSSEEKEGFGNLKDGRVKTRRKRHRKKSCLRGEQTKIHNFFGNFLPSELLGYKS